MKFARHVAHVGIFVGILRIFQYIFWGDLYGGYALVLAAHALISGVLILWLAKIEENKSKLIL